MGLEMSCFREKNSRREAIPHHFRAVRSVKVTLALGRWEIHASKLKKGFSDQYRKDLTSSWPTTCELGLNTDETARAYLAVEGS